MPSGVESFQVEAAPAGSVEVSTDAKLSCIAQSDADAHDTVPRAPAVRWMVRQAGRRAAGSRETITSPRWSSSTHSLADGHDMPSIAVGGAPGGIGRLARHAACAAPGSVAVITVPSDASATHSAAEGQSTAHVPGSRAEALKPACAVLHRRAPAAGSVET